MNAFLDRPLGGEWLFLWLDATYLKVRDGGRIVSVAAIIAVAVSTEGRCEIIGLGISPSKCPPIRMRFSLATAASVSGEPVLFSASVPTSRGSMFALKDPSKIYIRDGQEGRKLTNAFLPDVRNISVL